MNLFTPHHVQLLNSSYPPSSSLLTAGPEYSPNSQELSRLTYYASNHPGKLTKLGSELEKRIKLECRKAQAGNIRTRASLLISLAILRALATECRRDIALFSPSLIAAVAATMAAVPKDLEVMARAASVFTAWTTYTDGHLIGADSSMTREYITVLRRFAALSCSDVADQEVRNRTRLVGFAALTGALNSEALYNDSVQFKTQVSVIMKPILVTVFQTDVAVLEQQAEAVKDAPISPYLAEFRTRPAMERRAASIHVHIDGETGPSLADVSSAALRALFSLLEHANGNQLGYIMRASLDTLDEAAEPKKWSKVDHCCWFAKQVAEWAQYQYRYAIPTWLVERLVENQEAPKTLTMHTSLAAMVTAVFNSPTPLVNLSTSDVVSNLMNVLLRRTSISPDDSLLPAFVECISSLGRHVYYSDQIQDLAGEIINRLVAVESQGALSRGKQSRSQAIRCLIAGLLGLIHAAETSESAKTPELESPPKRRRSSSVKVASPAAQIANPELAVHPASRRSHVPTDIWQDTLSILCETDYAVRADYALGLVFYLENEIPTMGDSSEVDGVKRIRQLLESPFHQNADVKILVGSGDFGTKFLNAIQAYVYALATSSTLGLGSAVSNSPGDSITNGPTTAEPEGTAEGSEGQSQSHGRRSFSSPPPRARKVSVLRRLVERSPSRASGGASPVRGLITGVPMLLALDQFAAAANGDDAATVSRKNAIKIVVARTWSTIATVWGCADLTSIANKAIASIPAGGDLPASPDVEFGLHAAYESIPLVSEGEVAPWQGVDSQTALLAIASCASVHAATGLDKQAALIRLSVEWTAELALKDSVERSNTFESTIRGDGVSPLLKISPALMHIDNVSLQSLTRSTRGIGVTDLREALEGRSSMSNPALVKPPSLSTMDHGSSIGGDSKFMRPRTKSRRRATPTGPGEVRDVLNRLGIGKPNGSMLKSSFPAASKG
ncbi:Cellular morphogenesis-related protein [Mycena chlorophos]|uniref:Cellular morphogenesis-related protein n=1 Tax=Mycena chlorophos TaxID=658473 RepID=A0A8H6S4M2_MYCCL|nr:Cellular morphogenesis-related protein [Mycena chlorophos]